MIRTAPFFAVALTIALTFGGALGSIVLASRHLPWPGLSTSGVEAARTLHGHAQVFGFAALFVMGVAYHALPRLSGVALAQLRLARTTLWLQTGGVVVYALAAFAGPWRDPLATAAASVLLAGAAAFTRVVEQAVGTLARGAPAAPWLRAGAWWLVVATVLDVAAAAGARTLQPVVWEAALFGFVATWIFGMSMQFLPVLLGRDLPPVHFGVFAWYQVSVVASVLAPILLATTHPLRSLAAASLAAAALTVVVRLGVLGKPRRTSETDDGGAARFLLTAYGWLLASLACGPVWRAIAGMNGGFTPLLAEDFARHALTLGFLTQMIVGVTSRLVPAFSGRPLWSDRARGATYWLLNAAVATRGLQVVVERGGSWALWPWTAASGPLALAALTVFMVALIRGARPARAA
jgi:uncharacterized protein involved in response to NO